MEQGGQTNKQTAQKSLHLLQPVFSDMACYQPGDRIWYTNKLWTELY